MFWVFLSVALVLLILSRAFRLVVAWSAVTFVAIGLSGVAIWYWRGTRDATQLAEHVKSQGATQLAEHVKSQDAIRLAAQVKPQDLTQAAEHVQPCRPEPGASAATAAEETAEESDISCNGFDQATSACVATAGSPGPRSEQLGCQLDPGTAGSQ